MQKKNQNKPKSSLSVSAKRKQGSGKSKAGVESAAAAYSMKDKGPRAPKITSIPNGVRVSYREPSIYVHPVNNSFQTVKLPVNPGVSALFRWLPRMASGWNEWLLRGLKIKYRGRTATSTIGILTIAHTVDPTDPVPTDGMALLQWRHEEGALWSQEICLNVDLSRQGSPKFVRLGSVPPGVPAAMQDAKTLDYGYVVVAVDGSSVSNVDVGLVSVEYTVDFFYQTPQAPVCGWLRATIGASPALDDTHFFGTPNNLYYDGESVLPFHFVNPDTQTDSFTLDQAFEGVVVLQLSGTNIDPTAWDVTAAGGTGPNYINYMFKIVDGYNAGSYSCFRVNLTASSIITVHCDATTVTETRMFWCPGSSIALNGY